MAESSPHRPPLPPGKTAPELEIAFVCILILSGVYVAWDILGEPRGGDPFGHWLGIIGTLLMLMTETVYSVRKRTRLLNRYGAVRGWLSFHIVTGLVGPFLVLMHTGLAFRGLAGFTLLMTGVVVASGIIGRYLYTRLNRSGQPHPRLQRLFRLWHIVHIPLGLTLFASVALHIAAALWFRAGLFR
jgi:hypothetical protein